MLTEQDVLVLKLALERQILHHDAYADLLVQLQQEGAGANVPRLLRAQGIAGNLVGTLVDSAIAVGGHSNTVVARADLEQGLTLRALKNSSIDPQHLAGAQSVVTQRAREGRFFDLTEVLVERSGLGLLQAAQLRQKVRQLIATCARCHRHYLMHRQPAGRCKRCRSVIRAGEGVSAIDAWRGPAQSTANNTIFKTSRFNTPALDDSQSDAPQVNHTQPPRAAARRVTPPNASQAQDRVSLQAPRPPARPPARPRPARPHPAEPLPPESGAHRRPSGGSLKSLDPGAPVPIENGESATPPEGAPPAGGRPVSTPPSGAAAVGQDGGEEIVLDQWLEELAEDSLSVEEAVGKFANYEILSEIARGGMGVVYKARRQGRPEVLALKVLIAGAKANAKALARFEREAKVARRMDHPGVIKIYEAGHHEGYPFFAMEYVQGETLDDEMSKGPIKLKRALEILVEVADAVHYVHEQGVVHRDLKPQNIMLAYRVKLIDFGLVKADEGEKLTKTNTSLGTPTYMSPELVYGEAKQVGPATDVYALGAILYHMVTGKVPFEGENYMDLFHKIVESDPVPPSHVILSLPTDLDHVIFRAMAKEVDDRHPTAHELAEDLRRILDGQPLDGAPALLTTRSDAERPSDFPLEPSRSSFSLRNLLYLLVVVALALAVGFVMARLAPPPQ